MNTGRLQKWDNLPIIHNVYGNTSLDLYLQETPYVERPMYDSNIYKGKFIKIKKDGCIIPRRLSFNYGMFYILSPFRMNKKNIKVNDIKNYKRINRKIILTLRRGSFLSFETYHIGDAMVIEYIISQLIIMIRNKKIIDWVSKKN